MKDSLIKFGAKIETVKNPDGSVDNKLTDNIISIINAVIAVLGVACVIVMVIGGVQYMTSTGDTGKVEKGKKTILYGLIGLIICALAFAIVNFTVGKVNEATNSSAQSCSEDQKWDANTKACVAK